MVLKKTPKKPDIDSGALFKLCIIGTNLTKVIQNWKFIEYEQLGQKLLAFKRNFGSFNHED